jgi:hypothetical protein
MRNKRSNRLPAEPPTWWQRVIARERLPNRLFRHPKCEGTIEEHRMIALDVRELIRHRVFEQPVGSVFPLNLAFPWLRVMRLNSSSLELQLVTGLVVPLVWASCGVMGERLRLECPLCGRRVCSLYHLDGRVAFGVAMASGMRHSAPAATVEKPSLSGKSAASLATTVNSGRLNSHQSRATCGGGHTRVIARRWPVSSARSPSSNRLGRMSANAPRAAVSGHSAKSYLGQQRRCREDNDDNDLPWVEKPR